MVNIKEDAIFSALLDFVHEKTGYGIPLQPHSNMEDLFIDSIKLFGNGFIKVDYRYHFDEDGFSQYDKTVLFKGSIILTENGKIIDGEIEITHFGVDAHGPPRMK